MTANPQDFWSRFGDDSDFEEVTCDDSEGLARKVLSEFGIRCNSSVGGSLPNLDIKRMDAIQVIKLSLLEASADSNTMYEPYVNEDGEVEFIEIGRHTGFSGGDVYYEIQSGSYVERCGGVMVTGGRPLAYRKPTEWHPIWENGPSQVFDTSLLINKECIMKDFGQMATKVFTDPNLDSRYLDGIDNLYEITAENPYDSIIGYARYVHHPDLGKDTSITVTLQNSSKIPLPLCSCGDSPIEGASATLGTYFQRPQFDGAKFSPSCFDGMGEEPKAGDGVELKIPEQFRFTTKHGVPVDNFQDIVDIIVTGIEISSIRGIPPTLADGANPIPERGNAKIEIRIDKAHPQAWSLSKGTHYTVVYEDVDSDAGVKPYVVFADNSRISDPIKLTGDKVTFNIDPDCEYFAAKALLTDEGVILCTDETKGILVDTVYAVVVLDTPSIVVYHPDGAGNRAKTIAEEIDYLVSPLVVTEEPAPVAFNGRLLDLTQGIRDHDPTTVQNFTDTDLEKAYDAMSGSGLSLSLSFLDEDQCVRLSDALYDYMNSGDGTESTYVCGPDTDVSLGGTAPNGGIVNSIVYSYQDSNSYTISINSGQTILGNFSQVDGGPSLKVAEDFSAGGTIIQDLGNHIHFKVRVDSIGDRVAINMSPHVLRVGDKVQCTVHNNPVEM